MASVSPVPVPAAPLYIDAMMPAPTSRLFIALLRGDAGRDEMAALREAWTWPRPAALVMTSRLHLTLHFLGDVAVEHIAPLVPALAVPFAPFALRLDRAVLWPTGQGIAVLEPEAIPEALRALQAALASALRRAGIAFDERPYRPHVTLARRATGAVAPAAARHVAWTIHGYHLMSCAPAADGGYTTLHTYL